MKNNPSSKIIQNICNKQKKLLDSLLEKARKENEKNKKEKTDILKMSFIVKEFPDKIFEYAKSCTQEQLLSLSNAFLDELYPVFYNFFDDDIVKECKKTTPIDSELELLSNLKEIFLTLQRVLKKSSDKMPEFEHSHSTQLFFAKKMLQPIEQLIYLIKLEVPQIKAIEDYIYDIIQSHYITEDDILDYKRLDFLVLKPNQRITDIILKKIIDQEDLKISSEKRNLRKIYDKTFIVLSSLVVDGYLLDDPKSTLTQLQSNTLSKMNFSCNYLYEIKAILNVLDELKILNNLIQRRITFNITKNGRSRDYAYNDLFTSNKARDTSITKKNKVFHVIKKIKEIIQQ